MDDGEERIALKWALEVALRSEREMCETLTASQDVATKLAEELRLVKARLERFEGKPK